MKKNSGVVLALSLVILLILLILTGAFFWGTISESKSVNTERALFQALNLAEAGANYAQNQLKQLIPAALNTYISQDNSNKFKDYCTANNSLGLLTYYLGFTTSGCDGACLNFSANSASLATMFPGSNVQGSYSSTVVVTQNGNPQKIVQGNDERYIFNYNYLIDSTGSITNLSPAASKRIRMLQGSFSIVVRRDNFAKFALFTSHHSTPSGTTVWFTSNTNFTGPVSTNDRLSFAQNPGAHFTAEVSQHQEKARFYNNGWPVLIDADSNPPYDVPSFDQGFERGAEIVNLESSISQTELKNEALGTMNETGTNGIYVPNDGTKLTGGIYIRGDAAVAASVNASGQPVYTVTQGTTVKTIMVNYSANQTSIQTVAPSGTTTESYAGLPDGVSDQGTLIYGNGNITSLSGTVQKDSAVTVSSEKDIVITNNILYQQYNAGPPLNAAEYSNVLGILSWGGNVRIGSSAPNDIQVHGVVMAPHGIFTVDNYNSGSPRGTATLLGGAITDFYGPFGTFSGTTNISGYGRNFVYDARMLAGTTPPYFPYMKDYFVYAQWPSTKLKWQEYSGG